MQAGEVAIPMDVPRLPGHHLEEAGELRQPARAEVAPPCARVDERSRVGHFES